MNTASMAQEFQKPIPISEDVELTSPNSARMLSYPKYYKNTGEELEEINTDIVPSTDPNWDYQVTSGFWQLFVRGDGYFQAQHKGDIFTYRFSALGYGTGTEFNPI